MTGKQRFQETFILADAETTGNAWALIRKLGPRSFPEDGLDLCQLDDMLKRRR